MAVLFDRYDLQFILQQIRMAEYGQKPVNPHLAFGLRQVTGTDNNVTDGGQYFGAVDQIFPTFATALYLPDYDPRFTPNTAFGPGAPTFEVAYDQTPRMISTMVSDQGPANMAVLLSYFTPLGHRDATDPLKFVFDLAAVDKDGIALFNTVDGKPVINTAAFGGHAAQIIIADPADANQFIADRHSTATIELPNVTPDGGISAPFNTWFTLFGQFFDHGLDMVAKNGKDLVFIANDPTDPSKGFSVLSRTLKDANNHATNLVTPFVDNNQTYTSHPSHQAFLRDYALTQTGIAADGLPQVKLVTTGRLLDSHAVAGTVDPHLPTWADVKANALKLGIKLSDADVGNVPLLATDAYGNLITGAHGFAQVVIVEADGKTTKLVEGTAAGLDLLHPTADATETVLRIGHAFINDMARAANPFDDFGQLKATYDHTLLDAHYIGGDGRANENIGLTTIHEVFHNEHNRLVTDIQKQVSDALFSGDMSSAIDWLQPGTIPSIAIGFNPRTLDADGDGVIDAQYWNGDRLFQAGKFGTETQYQHLVFEEFARKVVPTIHVAGDTNIHLDPAIMSEFANAVYRFGHSMLDETLPTGSDPTITLLQAFTNPGLFKEKGAADIINGVTAQAGAEIDEFVTGTLRNTLLGMPQDLAALNIARGRDTGVPTLNAFRNEIYSQNHDANLRPYQSWDDFRHYLKHDASIYNFVAAYGAMSEITTAGDFDARQRMAYKVVEAGSDIANATKDKSTFERRAWDFMHSTGDFASVQDPTHSTDPRLLQSIVIDANGAVVTVDGTTDGLAKIATAKWSTGSVTGLDSVDMWVGGLAEKQALNGSLLGSTFELIFRVQMENLQDADRLYYLPRIEGMQYSDQIENNSFAELVMANVPGTKHLPASIFMQMEYTVEADDLYLKNPDGSYVMVNGQHVWQPTTSKAWQTFLGADGKVHPLIEVLGGTALTSDTPSDGTGPTIAKGTVVGGTLHFIGEDNYFGNTMVLGGTASDDKLLAGNADDDSVWADAGNDTVDGGGGNDAIYGGAGNDLITDQAGDNVVHGDAGNDTILMGKGADIIFGGDGNDWIEGGGGIDDIVGGRGNDIIYGGEGGEEIQGDEGDDWIVGGGISKARFGGTDGGDVLFGDVGAPTGQLPLYTGNDVLIGGVGSVMKGFGGDDVMVGTGGFLKFEGGTGFDWASFELETQGVSADMTRRELVSPLNPFGGDGIRDVFTHTEGLSGSKFDDDLKGEDTDKVAHILAKDGLYDPNLIIGLADTPADKVTGLTYKVVGSTMEGSFFAPGTTGARSAYGFASGDIILGGGGNDHLQGGGGDDILDGDAYLHVSLVQSPTGWEIRREIMYDTSAAVDTAVYADNAANYQIKVKLIGDNNPANASIVTGDQLAQVLTDGKHELFRDAEGFFTITHTPKVAGGGGGGAAAAPKTINEGTDLLRNIERVQFADGTVVVAGPNGLPSVLIKGNERNFAATDANGAPAVGDLLRSTHVITDPDGIQGAIAYQWQYQDLLRGEWIDIAGATNPDSFRPGDWLVGHSIRVKGTYLDGKNYQETVYSLAVGATTVGATGALLLADPTKNFGPTQSTGGGVTADFPDLHLFEGENLNAFVQIPSFFADDHTASAALHYRVVTPAGVTAVAVPGNGGIIGYVLTGRPTDIGANGRAKVTILVTDDAFGGKPALTAEADFFIDVMNKKAPVAGQPDSAPTAATAPTPADIRAGADPVGVSFDRVDLDWMLQQIKSAEVGQGPINPHVAFGLRTVSAESNSAVPGQANFGQSDQLFPRLITPVFQAAQNGTSYANTAPGNFIIDNDARLVSNLIADQSARNPAATAAALSQATVMAAVQDPTKGPVQDGSDIKGAVNWSIPNVTPDGGISAPFNTFFTLFGQFFDHGLDLLNKGGGVVQIGLDQSDPLFSGGASNAMFLSRGAMDGTQNTTNAVTPPVDLSQVYSSHPSHQVFLREYTFTAGAGGTVVIKATGRMLEDVDAAGVRHLPTWADVKANALKLGLKLTDADVNNVPELLTDAYGSFIRGAHGYVQVKVTLANGTTVYVEGTAAGLDLANPIANNAAAAATTIGETVGRTGIAFINDKSQDPTTLNSHFVAGDGRVNENIGLTAIHEIFLKEHNRLSAQIKLQVQQAINNGDTAFAAEWVQPDVVARLVTGYVIQPTDWNGERVFQAARFGTETQYQHLVFEEFARKVAPDIHVAGDTNIHLNPAVFAEFAHTVYRFGHSMLDETLGRDKIAADGTVSDDPIALMQAFTNPKAFTDAGANAAAGLILGGIHQVANEIDEFVTSTLRDNLLGQPLDLAALNIARGRSEGVPGLNLARNEIYSQNHDASLKPYESWHEFGQFLKHPESLVNFVAAYGTEIKGSSTNVDTLRTLAGIVVAAGEAESSKGNQTALSLQTAHLKTYADAYDYMHSLGFWKSDMTSALALHDASGNVPTYATGSVTGLDAVDFWIGGLAEKQNLHGGLLGTTFDFVFKLQMENLQDADRLYYLPRIEGMQYSDQIEGNSFAEIIMANTTLRHLPGNVFLTPEYTIEAKDFYAKDGLGNFVFDGGRHVWDLDALAKVTFKGADGLDHPLLEVVGATSIDVAGKTILAGGTLKFLGEDNFFGNTMVFGGTDTADKLMAGQADDDTIWADAGDDTVDGGGGNDMIYGGDGNDMLSNSNGSIGSAFHGDGGNDTIYGSKGDDAIFGGAGDDWLYGGQGIDDIIGGTGNDVIYGGEGAEEIQGDEGDDWIDGGPDGGDVLFGDVGAPTGQFPLYAGDDVLIGGVGTVMKGFAGDDIMVGSGGFTKFDGGTGFDWASFEFEVQGVDIDMNRREFIPNAPAGGDGVRDTYQLTEGASGSRFGDLIRGDNSAKIGIVPAKNELDNPTLIKGLADGTVDGRGNATLSVVKNGIVTTGTIGDHGTLTAANLHGGTIEGDFFTPGQPTGDPTTGAGFSGGNILLGGGGNDTIQGGAGNDIIDGDAWLHVALLPAAPGGSAQILREILYDTTAGNVDTAVFSDIRANYVITAPKDGEEGFITIVHRPPGVNGVVPVGDGTDRIRNIERLQFADKTIAIDQFGNEITAFDTVFDSVATDFALRSNDGTAVSVTGAPVVNAPLRVGINVQDLDGFTTTKNAAGADVVAVKVQWQYQDLASGVWVDIADPNDANPLLASTHATDVLATPISGTRFSATADFLPPDYFVGDALRAKVSYTDAKGYTETLYSLATPLLVEAAGVNTAPFVVQQNELVGMPNTATPAGKAIENLFIPLTTIFNDRETLPANLTYKLAIVTADGVAHDITGPTFMGLTFSVTPDAFGKISGMPLKPDGSPYVGAMNLRITAIDPQGMSATSDFTLDVLPLAANNPPKFETAVFHGNATPDVADFYENVSVAGSAVDPTKQAKTPAGTVIADLKVTDQLAISQTPAGISWQITNQASFTLGAQGSLFKLDPAAVDSFPVGSVVSTNHLSFALAPDFDTLWQKYRLAPNADVELVGGAANSKPLQIVFHVKVQASDGEFTVSQDETVIIENLDEKSTGGIRISGASVLNGAATLTAINSLADPDLVATGAAIATQWQVGSLVQGVFKWGAGTAGTSLTTTNGIVRATASYTDAFGLHDPTTDAVTISAEVYDVGSGVILASQVPATAFEGGNHNLTFVGVTTRDTISYAGFTTGVSVNLGTGLGSGGAAGDHYINIENATGGSANDSLTGDGNANVLTGGGGDDLLVGGGGVDTAAFSGKLADYQFGFVSNTGGTVQDLVTGRDGTDTVSSIPQVAFTDGAFALVFNNLASNNGTINLGATGANLVGNILVAGTNANNIRGSDGVDVIFADGGADTVDGGKGNDSIIGGAGNDRLTGGQGADSFIFNKGSGIDHITDFAAGNAAGHDFIDLQTTMGASSFSQVLTHADAASGHVVLTFGTDTIHLDNVSSVAALTANDFRFH